MNLSVISLLISNLVVIFLAIIQKWDIATVLWVYWAQSMIIGLFNFFRILSLKKFSTQNFTINNKPALPTSQTKIFTAFFFLFHYGFFHFIYAIFLFNFFTKEPPDFKYILTGAVIFFLNHFYSFWLNRIQEEKTKVNIGTLMFQPYLRIIPMHLVIIFGALLGNQSKLILFLGLKTAADITTHLIKHRQKPYH